MIAAIQAQVAKLAFAHTSFFTNEPMEALAEDLVRHAPAGIAKAYFVSGGSEAVEAALKLARQYFVEIGQPQRRRVIARRQSYHGNTLGALSTGGNQPRRRPFAPLLFEAIHVSPCYPYRDRREGESDDAYGARLADELEREIIRAGPDSVIAFVAETVAGATLGSAPPVPGYLRRIREVCDRHGVLLILDEVMCGMGRCGSLYACEQEGVRPDLIAIGKGLAAGYQPIGALLVSAPVYDGVISGTRAFVHGHTYSGHPVACAAALAVQRVLRDRGLLDRVAKLGPRFERALREVFGDSPHAGDIRGRGLLWSVELVAERSSRQPFEPAHRVHAAVKQRALALGLACYPMGGTIDGVQGDHVLLAPPYVVTEGQLDEIAALLRRAVDDAVAAAGAG